MIAVIGVAFVGSRLANVWPRDVETVYEVGSAVRELDVDYLQGGEAVASVRFSQTTPKTSAFRHIVRLEPGEYQIHITLYRQDGSATEHARRLAVPAAGVARFDLKSAAGSPE
jgi:hypothetical protein